MLLLLGAILALTCLVHWYLTRTHGYWASQKNVPTLPGCWPGVGHMLPSLLMREGLEYLTDRAYWAYRGASAVGIYFMRKPMLVLRDPDLVKQVLQSEFASFSQNGRDINPKADPALAKNPFFIQDMQTWRDSRVRVVSHLSGKKLSHLFVIAQNVSKQMLAFVERRLAESKSQEYEVELKKFFIRYTGEMVANSAFEVEGRSFADEREPGSFHVVAESLFEPNLVNILKQAVIFFLPELAGWADVRFIPQDAENFFRETLLSILKHRREQPPTHKPNDFLQFVLDTNSEDEIDSIIGDLLIYHMDVYETSSITLAFFMYQLSRNPEEQNKIRRHVRDVAGAGGKLTYESLKAMNYLEQAVYESLRLIPPIPAMFKRCTRETTLLGEDGLECRLRPGDGVMIPVLGLQNDPKHWDEPEAFRPDRFGPEKLAERNRYLFLAFGEGPRMCVGMRLGLMLVKLAAATMLLNYRIEPSAKSPWPLVMDRTSFLSYAKGGVWARFTRLQEAK